MKSVDTMLLGRKTSDASLRMGAKFPSEGRYIVFSRDARPADAPSNHPDGNSIRFVHRGG
jgi:hypothetical protein